MDNEKLTEIKDQGSRDMWQSELVEQAKTNAKRWFIGWLVTFAALIATNAYWIYTLNTYEYVYQDGSGQNNYNKNVEGDINNVTTDQEQKEQQEQGN